MDKKSSRSKIIEILNNYKENKPLKYFLLMFTGSFIIVFLLFTPVKDLHSQINLALTEVFIESSVNKKVGSGKQSQVIYDSESDNVSVVTKYYSKPNPDGTIVQKAININLFNEAHILVIFIIALFIASPINFREKLWKTFLAVFIIEIYLSFKIAALIFDNYSHPEFELAALEGLTKYIVFYYNKLIKSVGNGLNYLIVAFVWLIVSGLAMKFLDKKEA